jgi:hypothetical protein
MQTPLEIYSLAPNMDISDNQYRKLTEFVHLKKKIGMPVTCKTIEYMHRNLPHHTISCSIISGQHGSGCAHQEEEWVLPTETILCQKLPPDFEKLMLSSNIAWT